MSISVRIHLLRPAVCACTTKASGNRLTSERKRFRSDPGTPRFVRSSCLAPSPSVVY
jgi:hypothetical protein